MKFDLTKLNSGIEDVISIDTSYSFSSEELAGSDIMKLDNVSVVGEITRDSSYEYTIYLNIKGVMILPCALTLAPVEYPFNIEINDNLNKILEEIGGNVKKVENSLDIFPIVWENILMEIPMRVVSDEAKTMNKVGNGWRLITEESDTPLEKK